MVRRFPETTFRINICISKWATARICMYLGPGFGIWRSFAVYAGSQLVRKLVDKQFRGLAFFVSGWRAVIGRQTVGRCSSLSLSLSRYSHQTQYGDVCVHRRARLYVTCGSWSRRAPCCAPLDPWWKKQVCSPFNWFDPLVAFLEAALTIVSNSTMIPPINLWRSSWAPKQLTNNWTFTFKEVEEKIGGYWCVCVCVCVCVSRHFATLHVMHFDPTAVIQTVQHAEIKSVNDILCP